MTEPILLWEFKKKGEGGGALRPSASVLTVYFLILPSFFFSCSRPAFSSSSVLLSSISASLLSPPPPLDQWQQNDQLFICRMKASTKKKIISQNTIPADSIVFFDAMVLLGTAGVNQSKTPLRLVGYQIENELRFQPVDTMNQEYRKNLMEHRNVPGVQRENENTRDAFSIDQVSLKFTVSRGTG